MGMLIASILLLIASFLFFFSNSQNAVNRILAAAAFITSIGTFGSYMETNLIPDLIVRGTFAMDKIIFLEYLCSFILSLGHFVPYSIMLLFSIYFAGLMKDKKRSFHIKITLIILIPTILSFILFPIGRQFKPDFKFLSFWCGLYLLFTIIILLRAYLNSYTTREKWDIVLVFATIIPAVASQYLMVMITQALGDKNTWKYSYWIVSIAFIIHISLIIKYGVFGLRIRFEKNRMDTALKTINSSSLIYNHAVKNEVSKMSLCTQNIISVSEKIQDIDIKFRITQNSQIIEDSVNHLLNLVERISANTRQIELIESIFSLNDLIGDTLKGIQNTFTHKNIVFNKMIHSDFEIKGDITHLRECLNNVVKNSIEAIQSNGVITISLRYEGRLLALSVEDNGPGIPEKIIPYLFNPFYSTKRTGINFGLGLFYCYNVMRKHNGSIEVKSKVGSSTIVSLIFPTKRIVKNKMVIQRQISVS
ncbi:MAG: HAMP domain-containing histidine kinase [Clostridia bacterium]|nr:HAMP domain-containing histidine kinase [Clostridia bacterium]